MTRSASKMIFENNVCLKNHSVCMDKDELYQSIRKKLDRLRWASLSSDPDYVQLCHDVVEDNAERIEKALETISRLKDTLEIIANYKDALFPTTNEETWGKTIEFQQTLQEVTCHLCECIDVQSNFLLMIKNALISQHNAERALIYRHIQVDLVRAFQRLNFIDEYIRKNDNLFAVESQRRDCNKQKNKLNKKYGIERGALHEARNKTAAHWDKEVDYIELYERSKDVSCDQIREICIDMFNLTQAYSQCLQDALNNYMESVKKDVEQNDCQKDKNKE